MTCTLWAQLFEFTLIIRQILLTMKQFPDTICRENQSTHFAHMNFISENHAVYEIIRKYMIQPERPQLTI